MKIDILCSASCPDIRRLGPYIAAIGYIVMQYGKVPQYTYLGKASGLGPEGLSPPLYVVTASPTRMEPGCGESTPS